MGLEVIAYSRVDFVCDLDSPSVPGEDRIVALGGNSEEFAARFAGPDGIYRYGDTLTFLVGSYVGYGQWRELLAELAAYPVASGSHALGAWKSTEGPFWELIDFPDSEGVIGAEVSAKLHVDFTEWRSRAQAFAHERGLPQFMDTYDGFANAFAWAADRGAVVFC